MKVLILSRRRTLYSTRRLAEAAAAAGHAARVVDPLACCMRVDRRRPTIHQGARLRRLPEPDVVVPRMGALVTDYALAVLNQMEMMGTPVVNRSQAIARARDKFRTLQILTRHDLDIPRTVIVRDPGQIAAAVERVGGPPVVLKLIRGTQGIGVMLAERLEQVQAIIETVWDLGHEILIQEFVRESEGRDLRALVVGEQVVAAIRREARVGEFRANIHRGGAAAAVRLDPAAERAAITARRVMGLQVAGVDLLESAAGPKVLEINASPGLEALESATGVDVAGAIVDYAVRHARSQRDDG